MLKIPQDLRFALRSWRGARGFAALAILTLGLGIGATTALFSVVNAILLRSFGYRQPERLVLIGGLNRQGQQTGVSAPDFQAFQQRARSIELAAVSRVQSFTLLGPREPISVFGQMVSHDCFAILGAAPLMGRVLIDADYQPSAPPVAVLSHKLWQRDFAADPRIVGQSLLIDGVNYIVAGVMRPEFQFPHPAFLIWTPWRLTAAELANRRAHAYRLIARLRPGVAPGAAERELAAISAALARDFPDTNGGWRTHVAPVNEALLANVRPALLTMLGAVGFVLLIACLNVSNLLMARGLARGKELAIRSALGAGRGRLAAQLLIESLAIAAAGGALGLAIAGGLLRVLLAMLSSNAVPSFPRLDQASLDPGVLAAAVSMTLGCGLLFGLLPAIELSRPDIEAALKEGGRSNTGGVRHRRFLSGLIVLEAALSVVLLVGAGLMLRSFARILEVKPGFQPEHVLSAGIPSPWLANFASPADRTAAKARYFDSIVEQLRTLPAVTAAAVVTGLPMGNVAVQTLIRLEGSAPGADDLRLAYTSVSPDYFRVMGIPLRRGRTFADTDTAQQPMVAVIDEAMARHVWPGQDPIGKRFTFNPSGAGPFASVIGVVAEVHALRLTEEPDSQLYMSHRQSLLAPHNASLVVRTTLDPGSLATALRDAVHRVDPGQPVAQVRTMNQVVADSVAQPRLYTVLLVIFGALALVLAAAGIFAVLSWTVNRKTAEIGIRMALGATSGAVVASVMRRALIEVLAGIGLGLAGAAALTGFLRSQLFHIGATDPIAYIAAPAALLAAAVCAAYLPARRATQVDPAKAVAS